MLGSNSIHVCKKGHGFAKDVAAISLLLKFNYFPLYETPSVLDAVKEENRIKLVWTLLILDYYICECQENMCDKELS